MGGNALAQQGFATRRVSAGEYHDQLVPAIIGKLHALFPGIEAEVIRSYRDKLDFGDMDVIVNSDTLPNDAAQQVLDGFRPAAHHSNGPVLSFEYEGLQIDLIHYRTPVYNFARHYFAYNDLGNLIGRTARRMGFIFGHDGLRYILRDSDNGDQVIAKIGVIQDFERALLFMGFNRDMHARGFADREAIFRYAASTPYFDPEAFLLHNRNHRARMRDRKRPNYTAFLDWMRNNRPEPGALAGTTPANHLKRARRAFPEFRCTYDQSIALHERDRQFRRLLNGERVSRVTGLEGKALGRAMAVITAQAGGTEALRETVLRLGSTSAVDDYVRRAVPDGMEH